MVATRSEAYRDVMDESSKVSKDAAADTVNEPVHIFDQTNGMMPKTEAEPEKGERTGAANDATALGTYTVAYGARGTTF